MAGCPPRLLPRTHLEQQLGARREGRHRPNRPGPGLCSGEKQQEDNQRQVRR